jgi:hypothetical protein
MDNARFNEACRNLSPTEAVDVTLITGRIIKGFPLRHTPAGAREGSIELETAAGIINLLASAIENIEPHDGQLA